MGVHGKLDGLESVRLERERRLPNSRVLGPGEGHARARRIGLACRARASADGEVVGLGASGREHDFRRLRAEDPRHLDTGGFHRLPRGAARAVDGGRIRGQALQPRPHDLEHLGVEGRRGMVIRVDLASDGIQETGPPDGRL